MKIFTSVMYCDIGQLFVTLYAYIYVACYKVFLQKFGFLLFVVSCYYSDKHSKRARDMHLLKQLKLLLKEEASDNGTSIKQGIITDIS